MRKAAELPTRGGFERVSKARMIERVNRFEDLSDSRKFRVHAPESRKWTMPTVEFSATAELSYELRDCCN